MTPVMIMTNSIILLYREALYSSDVDKALVREVIKTIETPKDQVLIDNEVVLDNLRGIVENMLAMPDVSQTNKHNLMANVRSCTFRDTSNGVFELIRENVDLELTPDDNHKVVSDIKRQFKTYLYEHNLKQAISKASRDLKFNRNGITDIIQFATKLSEDLDSFVSNAASKRTIDEVDISDLSAVGDQFKRAKEDIGGSGMYVSGWKDINDMIGGGFISGKSYLFNALPNRYKTSMLLSLNAQIPRLNKPITKVTGKKPLIVRHVLEDAVRDNLVFLYVYLFSLKHGIVPEVKKISDSVMAEYIKTELMALGWHFKLVKREPTEMTYKVLLDDISYFDSIGYETKVWFIDHLTLVPATGCIKDGPMGSDLLDMSRRIKNYCAKKDITMISSWHLSTAVNDKLKNGTPPQNLVREIRGLGMTKNTGQINQEMDVIVNMNMFPIEGITFLTLDLDRIRNIIPIPEVKRYVCYQLPETGPLLEDYHLDSPIGHRELPRRQQKNNSDGELF